MNKKTSKPKKPTMQVFACITCGKEIRSNLPQSIGQQKCVLCREQIAGKKLTALE